MRFGIGLQHRRWGLDTFLRPGVPFAGRQDRLTSLRRFRLWGLSLYGFRDLGLGIRVDLIRPGMH